MALYSSYQPGGSGALGGGGSDAPWFQPPAPLKPPTFLDPSAYYSDFYSSLGELPSLDADVLSELTLPNQEPPTPAPIGAPPPSSDHEYQLAVEPKREEETKPLESLDEILESVGIGPEDLEAAAAESELSLLAAPSTDPADVGLLPLAPLQEPSVDEEIDVCGDEETKPSPVFISYASPPQSSHPQATQPSLLLQPSYPNSNVSMLYSTGLHQLQSVSSAGAYTIPNQASTSSYMPPFSTAGYTPSLPPPTSLPEHEAAPIDPYIAGNYRSVTSPSASYIPHNYYAGYNGTNGGYMGLMGGGYPGSTMGDMMFPLGMENVSPVAPSDPVPPKKAKAPKRPGGGGRRKREEPTVKEEDVIAMHRQKPVEVSPFERDPSRKPSFSYVALVTMVLQASPTGSLTLQEIYNAVSAEFPFYRLAEKRWQNSIRHTMSFNDCFIRVQRDLSRRQDGSRDRGGYWALHPNCGDMFSVGKNTLRRSYKFRLPGKPVPKRKSVKKEKGANSDYSFTNITTNPPPPRPSALTRVTLPQVPSPGQACAEEKEREEGEGRQLRLLFHQHHHQPSPASTLCSYQGNSPTSSVSRASLCRRERA